MTLDSVTHMAPRHDSSPGEALASLSRNGFAVVEDIFSPDDLREAEALLDQLFREFSSLQQSRRRGQRIVARDMATAAGEGIDQPEILYAASLNPALERTSLFRKCTAFAQSMTGPVTRAFDHAIVKSPFNMSVTPWHQDAALTRFRHLPRFLRGDRLHFWIPLQDATPSNGCMEFVAGSHRQPLLKHESFIRARGDSGWAASPGPDAPRVACPVRAGGFTIHTPGTLHYAGRNETAASRKAWIIHFSRFGSLEIALKRMLSRVPAPLPGLAASDRRGY